MRVLILVLVVYLFSSSIACRAAPAAPAPYPPSHVIAEVKFDFLYHDRRAHGSDNWPITWADDDHQYAAWGDGGGFGGTNKVGRVSLGVARVEGNAESYRGVNVWGGHNGENPAIFKGKSYGLISVQGTLYMWVSPGSDARSYGEARLYRSTNYGASWTEADWAFLKSDHIIMPTFLQFGKDYEGARDDFVYIYASNLRNDRSLQVQTPGEVALMRVPKTSIMDRSRYDFFAGVDEPGNPKWTSDLAAREPVFRDPNGVGWNLSVSYNPGLQRYLLMTEHTKSSQGNFGMFDAPAPWGPWTTVNYVKAFGAPSIQASTFFWNFSNKWLSADGEHFVLVFTGVSANDSWNMVRGRFVVFESPEP
jgi:Domain of unknown function (DUF4185)